MMFASLYALESTRRTPWVDAPSAILSGDAPGGEGFMFLFGRTDGLDDATLATVFEVRAERLQTAQGTSVIPTELLSPSPSSPDDDR